MLQALNSLIRPPAPLLLKTRLFSKKAQQLKIDTLTTCGIVRPLFVDWVVSDRKDLLP
jgi:hypothetical protein